MPFPIGPDPRFRESEALFRVQDPFGLRRSVTPVFMSYQETGEFVGCGTSFFITPFGRQLSAMHVITDFFNEQRITARPNERRHFEYRNVLIQILFDPGLVFGTARAGSLLHVTHFAMFPVDQRQHPLAATMTLEQLDRVEVGLDLTSWDCSGFSERTSEFLPIRVGSGPVLKMGSRVLAIGYPANNGVRRGGTTITTYRHEMFGSIGTVTDVAPEYDPAARPSCLIAAKTANLQNIQGRPCFSGAKVDTRGQWNRRPLMFDGRSRAHYR
jgi:hypothetical protein